MRFQYPLLQIPNGFIKTPMLAPGAVTTPVIADDAVTALKVAAGAIGNPELAANAVASGNLADLAVISSKIANAAVGNPQLAWLAVATANIVDAAVATAKIADGAVATTKIANAAITNALIANLAVGTANIQTAAITNALIANLAVGTANIQDLAVTSAKVNDLAAGKITAGTITATIEMLAATLTGGKIRTAVSGQRIEISAAAGVDLIQFFSGDPAETSPGRIQVGSAGEVIIQSARISGAPAVTLQLSPSSGPLLSAPAVTQPTLSSPWTEVHATSYFKTAQGEIVLTGTVTGGAYPSTLFTLPGGYRPFAFRRFAVASASATGTGYIDVDTSGNVIASAGAGYICLDGVVFGPGPGIPA